MRTALYVVGQIQWHPFAYFVHLVSEMKSVSLVGGSNNQLLLVNVPRKDIEGTPETVAEGQKAPLENGVWLDELVPPKADRTRSFVV